MVSGVGCPPPYNDQTDINEWIEDLEDYFLGKFGSIDDQRKLAILRRVFGETHLCTVKELISRMPSEERVNYDQVKAVISKHFGKSRSVIVERHNFHCMRQQVDESIECFVSRLREQATKCKFVYEVTYQVGTGEAATEEKAVKDISEEMIRDCIVVGMQDETTRARLFREPDLTLQKTMDMIRAVEVADEYVQKIKDPNLQVNKIYAKRKQKPQISSSVHDKQSVKTHDKQNVCGKCGKSHAKKQCPAFGKTCHKCKKQNHFASMCRARQVNMVDQCYDQNVNRTVQPICDFDGDTDLFLGMIDVLSGCLLKSELEVTSVVKDWNEDVLLDGCPIRVKIDTGAQTNVISNLVLNSILPNPCVDQCNVTLSAYGGTKIPVKGVCKLKCQYKNQNLSLKFVVVPLNVTTVLGLDSCSRLGIVKIPNQNSVREENIVSEIEKRSKSPTHITSQPQVRPPHVSERYESVAPIHSNSSTSKQVTGNLRKVLAEYQDVFSEDSLGCIGKYPYTIKLKNDAVPVIHPVRKIPFSRTEPVEKELERMQRLGCITPVDVPTEWVNSMVVTEKPGTGTVRVCLDPSSLNKFVMREHTPLPTEEEILSKLQEATVFSKLDAKDGYWQVPLDEKSSMLTTFNTHIGRFRYLRLPFGLNSSNEVFQKRMTQVFKGLPGITVMFDDVLVHGKDLAEHDERVAQALKRTREVGLNLNRKKCKFQLPEVRYIGHVINANGISPDPQKIEDIQNMPRPTDKTGIQRILGTLNFLHKFIPNMSELTAPLRSLLVKGIEFQWSFEQDAAMKKIIEVLTSTPVLGFYDSKKDITLASDASQNGLGACLMQDNKPIAYASRSLTATQKNYAQIEKELLSIVFGAERFYQYLYGKKVRVETDHKPLIPLFKKPIFEAPARIQRLMLRLQRYDLDVHYIPGKFMFIPDTLSRAVSTVSSYTDRILEKEADLMIHMVIQNLNCSSEMKSHIRNLTGLDEALVNVKLYIQNGWPNRISECEPSVKPYWHHRASLSFVSDMILFGDRIVVPTALRKEILERIHSGHQGRERCKISARRVVYWPGMNAQIDETVNKCEACLLTRNAPPREPLNPHRVPDRAWQKVACDIYEYAGEKWQIVTDFFSKWVEVKQLPVRNVTSKHAIEHLKSVASRYGIPEEIFSDGDPIYTSVEFKQFCKAYGIDHTFSSAKYPQSNGMIENSVKHVKNLLRRCKHSHDDLYLALLDYRNTPLSSNVGSPAQLLLNRNLRTRMPCVSEFLNTKADTDNRELLFKKQSNAEHYYNRTAQRERPKFKSGDIVRYRDSLADKIWQSGQILRANNSRSYELLNPRGNVIRRNSRFLITDQTKSKFDTVPCDIPSPCHVAVPNPTPNLVPNLAPPPKPQNTMNQETIPQPRRSARLASKPPVKYF